MKFNNKLLKKLLIKELKKKIRPTHISSLLGFSSTLISNLKTGRIKHPRFFTVVKLVNYFKVNYEDFILEDDK